jgi:hypothetical protein
MGALATFIKLISSTAIVTIYVNILVICLNVSNRSFEPVKLFYGSIVLFSPICFLILLLIDVIVLRVFNWIIIRHILSFNFYSVLAYILMPLFCLAMAYSQFIYVNKWILFYAMILVVFCFAISAHLKIAFPSHGRAVRAKGTTSSDEGVD